MTTPRQGDTMQPTADEQVEARLMRAEEEIEALKREVESLREDVRALMHRV